jgi:phospholipid/cholesterol/gamma-HCH transport system substrate-binding protein
MGRNLVETVMGAVVLAIAGFFLAFAYNTSDLRKISGYSIVAKFNSVEGLNPGSDVRVGGVKVGSVSEQRLDPVDYRAVIVMSILSDIKIPVDSEASVTSDGLLGANYVRIKPGHEKKSLEPGGEIAKTHDVVDLEQLMGRVIFLLGQEGGSSE